MKKAEIINMNLIEEIKLSNGLKLSILDLSREIAADTVKVEISFTADIDLKKSFFSNNESYRKVANIFGNTLTYKYKMERAFVQKEKQNAVREELINTFKANSLGYLSADNFAQKLALAMLRDIKNNPYKYQTGTESET
jgi:hypothetical protein